MSVATDSTYLAAIQQALAGLDQTQLADIVETLYSAFLQGRTVFTCGNGASAALAAHMACDLGKGTAPDVGRGVQARAARRLRVISLVDNAALVTAIGNDIEYADVFVEQLKNLLEMGDVVVGISGSGQSPNVVRALDYAHRNGATTIGFTGARAGAQAMARHCNVCLRAPLTMMEQIEDVHVICHHLITVELRRRIAEWSALSATHDTQLSLVGE